MKRKDFIKTSFAAASSIALMGSTFEKYSKHRGATFYPPQLEKGQTIALFAPAGAVFDPNQITKAKRALNQLGYNVHLAPSLHTKHGYFSATIKERIEEFNSLLSNPKINALIAMRGGWGCAQLLPELDLQLIKDHPKIIMGYSDLTALLNYITQQTGLITYHGVMGYSTWNDFAVSEFCAQLEHTAPKRELINPKNEQDQLTTLRPGIAKGELYGGNLSVIASLVGTKQAIDFSNKLLFLEETHEEPYRIDRMLYQLESAGIFSAINGLILGQFAHCQAETPAESFTLEEVFGSYFSNFSKPVYAGASFGHVRNKFILPVGAFAEMNADRHTLLLEA